MGGVDPEQTRALFWEYTDAGMQLRLDYHVTLDDWLAVRDEVDRAVQRAFEDEGLSFGVPTRRLRLGDAPDEPLVPREPAPQRV